MLLIWDWELSIDLNRSLMGMRGGGGGGGEVVEAERPVLSTGSKDSASS